MGERPRSLRRYVPLLAQVQRDVSKFRAANIDRGDLAWKLAGVFQPVGLRLELRSVADGFTGRGIRHRAKGERALLAAGKCDQFERGRRDADEVFGMTVEHVGRQFAGRRIADEFQIVGMLANLDERSTVRRAMRMASATRRGFRPGTTAGRNEEEGGEEGR
jgi:hypothetical protein